jgi:hypothetical protein
LGEHGTTRRRKHGVRDLYSCDGKAHDVILISEITRDRLSS